MLEELTRRAPNLELADQELDYPPIIAFRGSRKLWLNHNQKHTP